MAEKMPFGEVLEVIDQLPTDDQEALLAIVRRRLAERGRKRLAAEIKEAEQEFAEDGCRPVAAEELAKEILS